MTSLLLYFTFLVRTRVDIRHGRRGHRTIRLIIVIHIIMEDIDGKCAFSVGFPENYYSNNNCKSLRRQHTTLKYYLCLNIEHRRPSMRVSLPVHDRSSSVCSRLFKI